MSVVSPLSLCLGRAKTARAKTDRLDERRGEFPTHRPPPLPPPSHNTQQAVRRTRGEREKTDMFPQSASTLRQAEISPLPPACSDRSPALSSGNFPISFPSLQRGQFPTNWLQHFWGQNRRTWLQMTRFWTAGESLSGHVAVGAGWHGPFPMPPPLCLPPRLVVTALRCVCVKHIDSFTALDTHRISFPAGLKTGF